MLPVHSAQPVPPHTAGARIPSVVSCRRAIPAFHLRSTAPLTSARRRHTSVDARTTGEQTDTEYVDSHRRGLRSDAAQNGRKRSAVASILQVPEIHAPSKSRSTHQNE